jgi:quercetin dioxygenase-like cupin family protein
MRSDGARSASLAAIENTMTAGSMPPLHLHEREEAFHVIEGSLTLYAGDQTVRLEAGDTFLAPKCVPHTHRAESERVRYLAMMFVTSVSRYEDFLHAVSRPADALHISPAESWPKGEEATSLAAIGAANGITILGPPGVLPAGAFGHTRTRSPSGPGSPSALTARASSRKAEPRRAGSRHGVCI